MHQCTYNIFYKKMLNISNIYKIIKNLSLSICKSVLFFTFLKYFIKYLQNK